jgi:hypothetical protein
MRLYKGDKKPLNYLFKKANNDHYEKYIITTDR